MAKNVPGAEFISDGVKYVLGHGPTGNLRPFTVGPITTVAKLPGGVVVIAAVAAVGLAAAGIAWMFSGDK